MKILIDPGHGVFTPGKRSPDGEFREGIYNREIAARVVADLQDRASTPSFWSRKTLCPAVVTESFYMDNRSDLEFLQSRAGKQAVIDTHVEGITEYLETLKVLR